MARERFVVRTLSVHPDGPGAVRYRVVLRQAPELGEPDRDWVLYVRQAPGQAAPYAEGAEVELDTRLLADPKQAD